MSGSNRRYDAGIEPAGKKNAFDRAGGNMLFDQLSQLGRVAAQLTALQEHRTRYAGHAPSSPVHLPRIAKPPPPACLSASCGNKAAPLCSRQSSLAKCADKV